MAAKSTNQHWEVIAQGLFASIETAKDLWENSLLYFQWCDANPIQKPEFVRSGSDAGTTYYVPIPRPYTIHGLCMHLGITREWLYDVSKQKERNDFYFVANRLVEIIYTQKLEYALTGIFSPVVAAKELGLNHTAKDGAGAPVINIEVQQGPGLLEDERDVDLPEDKK